jgi:hypothetical protein
MVSTASPVATLTEREIVSVDPNCSTTTAACTTDRVTWGWDIGLGDYTRDTLFIDAQSIAIHGEAPIIEYSFRGLHPGAHTDNMIRTRMDAIRDAYSYPPQRTLSRCSTA